MRPARVLIAEDNQIVSADLADSVRDLGYEVVGTASSGEDSIRLALELKPDLTLMDITLEGRVDGIAAGEKIARTGKIPVIFVTAHGDPQTVSRTTASGAFGHLTKPVRKGELQASLAFALHQHRASQELLDQKAWLATLVASIDEGVVAVDRDFRVSYLNPRAEEITGWQLEDALGKAVEEVYTVLSPDRNSSKEPRLRTAARTGQAFRSARLTLRTASGEELPVEEIVSPLVRANRTAGAVAIVRDLRETLRLERAQKLETIGVLAGGVAHDFNNLLAVMVGNASLAMESLKPGSNDYIFLEQVLASGRKAAELTAQLLAYAGKSPLRRSPVSLAKTVRDILDLIKTTISPHISLSVDVPDSLPMIIGDQNKLQQVLMHLVTNASEAIGADPGFIEISAALDGHTGFLVLRVRDSGPGMDAETSAKIFDPFFSTKFTGRGLGLAAVEGIVRSHDGTIDVDTRPGGGTVFNILLPVTMQAGHSIPVLPKAALQGHGTVLVVDDVDTVSQFAKVALERLGYKVIVTESGEAALEVVEQRGDEIDLVLLDFSMPGLSGAETWERIRRLRPNLPICAMSGYNETIAESQFPGSNGNSTSIKDCFLQKPFTPEQLAGKVRSILAQNR